MTIQSTWPLPILGGYLVHMELESKTLSPHPIGLRCDECPFSNEGFFSYSLRFGFVYFCFLLIKFKLAHRVMGFIMTLHVNLGFY